VGGRSLSLDLAAALDALAKPAPKTSRCGVGLYLAQLAKRDEALHARVVGLIDDDSVQATDLAQALEADDSGVSAYTLRRHRNRGATGCRCPR
jgi:hypothetical protein